MQDLPENFLDTISPQQPSQSSLNHSLAEHTSSPQLASLAPMSISNESSSHYGINSMGSQYGGSSSLDKPRYARNLVPICFSHSSQFVYATHSDFVFLYKAIVMQKLGVVVVY